MVIFRQATRRLRLATAFEAALKPANRAGRALITGMAPTFRANRRLPSMERCKQRGARPFPSLRSAIYVIDPGQVVNQSRPQYVFGDGDLKGSGRQLTRQPADRPKNIFKPGKRRVYVLFDSWAALYQRLDSRPVTMA